MKIGPQTKVWQSFINIRNISKIAAYSHVLLDFWPPLFNQIMVSSHLSLSGYQRLHIKLGLLHLVKHE